MKKLLITATLLLLLSLKPLFAGVDKGIDVAEVQKMLTELCIDAGPIDGVWGRKTEAAVKDFLYNYSGQFGENDMKILKSHHWLFAKEKKCDVAPKKNVQQFIPNETLVGKPCIHGRNISSVTNFPIALTHKETISKVGCQSVSSVFDIEPVTGNKMIMITLPPNYCSRDDGHDDCTSDRSRVEFYDKKGVTNNSKVNYNYWMFIPSNTDLSQGGTPNTTLGQLNTVAYPLYRSLVMVRWLQGKGIAFQVHNDFSWEKYQWYYIKDLIPINKQKDRWINISYIVNVHDDEKGALEIFVDGKSIFKKENFPTIKPNGKIQLKMGIYNFKVSAMGSNRSTQKVFFDNITRSVKSSWN